MENLYNNTILIVDDTPENIDILVELLEDFDKQIAINGADALETAFEEPHPDLILLDIMMPEMDGYEVCEKLRADDRTKNIPIIFLTAKALKEDIVKGFEVGGQDYITKPFDARELMERVKTHLELKTQREILKNMNVILEEKVQERTAELKDAMTKIDAANKELKALDIAKNNFLEMISHEIRTPLNGIGGAANLLKDSMEDDHELIEFVDMLKESAERLEKFATTALVITQLQAHNYQVVRKPINIHKLVKASINKLKSFAEESKVTVASESPEPFLEMNAEEGLIYRAFESIIHNAIKYSSQNGLVRIKSYQKNGKIIIEVNDQGKGFSEEAMNNLFQTFGIGETHYDQNIGLSLKASKLIVEAHEGEIFVHNFPGEGSQIQFVFEKEK